MQIPSVINGEASFHYGFAWQEKPPSVVIELHPELLEKLPVVPEDIFELKESFGFRNFFNNPKEEVFGFDDGVVLRQGERFILPIPSFIRGSRESQQRFYAISATLNALFGVLNYGLKEKLESSYLQLIGIFLMTVKEMQGCGISASIAPLVKDWLVDCSDKTKIAEEIRGVMVKMYRAIFPSEEIRSDLFVVFHEDSRPHINCNVGATDIGVNPGEFKRDRGFAIESHNVDHPQDQLLLLAALIGLYQCAWQGLYGSQSITA